MKRDTIAFKQFGNTCGFYSLIRCVYEFVPLKDPSAFIYKMVNECKMEEDENRRSKVGEVFEIEHLKEIAIQNMSRDVLKNYSKEEPKELEISLLPIKNSNDIAEAMKDNAKVVFPILSEKGNPHYVSLLSLNDERVTYSDQGVKLKEKDLLEMYELNQKIGNKYNWKKFKFIKIPRLIRFGIYKFFRYNEEDIKYYEKDIKQNTKNKKKIRKSEPSNVNMKGWCLQIKVREKHT